jgi:hypothetical protein
MSLLPLSRLTPAGEACVMRNHNHQVHGIRRLAGVAVTIARWVADAIAECNEAQRRLIALRMSPHSYAADPDNGPDTYGEFLFRTSGPLGREPSARHRAAR